MSCVLSVESSRRSQAVGLGGAQGSRHSGHGSRAGCGTCPVSNWVGTSAQEIHMPGEACRSSGDEAFA